MDKEDETVQFETNKFGYYLLIQNKYIDENTRKLSDILSPNLDPITLSQGITFLNLEDKITNTLEFSSIQKIADKLFVQLAPNNYEYFSSFDSELRKKYDRYAVAFYNTFVNLETFIKSKDSNARQVILTNLPIVAE
jgi:hypothetical protein